MANFDVPTVRPDTATGWQRVSWYQTLVLHLVPASVTLATALLLAPVMARLGMPRGFALTVAFALVLIPIELGLLLGAAHRATGRWSLWALPAVLAYRRPLGRWWLATPVLLAVALALAVAWTPAGNAIGGWLRSVYPTWLLPGYDMADAGVRTPVLVIALLVTLLVDGLVNPTVEELYFRGYLLPRLPLAGWRAIPLSAALFAMQHYWQPYNWLLIFALQVMLTAFVVRSRSLRLGVVMHVLANSLGVLGTLAVVLASAGS